MRFMMIMMPKSYENPVPAPLPSLEDIQRMGAYNQELEKAGVLLDLDGLHHPAKGFRVTFDTGKAVLTDGPFAEAKEVVGGYWIIDVKSREEAMEWASRIPGTPDETVEVRPFIEMTDFPPEMQKPG